MRRRAVESRRLPRRRLSGWIWFLFAISALAALVLLTVSRGQVEKTESLFLVGFFYLERVLIFFDSFSSTNFSLIDIHMI